MAIPEGGKLTRAQLGKWGEQLAHDTLVAKGYAILERNWKMGHYEVDLVAMHGDKVVFVEVKTRSTETYDPIDAVNNRKRARIIASADVYIRHFNIAYEYQFDIISVVGAPGNYTVEHIEDAYFPSLKRFNRSFHL